MKTKVHRDRLNCEPEYAAGGSGGHFTTFLFLDVGEAPRLTLLRLLFWEQTTETLAALYVFSTGKPLAVKTMKRLKNRKSHLLLTGLLWAALTAPGFGCGKFASSPPDRAKLLDRGCECEPKSDTHKPTLDENTAIELALKNYKQLFGELASRGEVPGEWVQLVSPTKEQILVTQTANSWELVHDGNVGLVVHAKVDKKSGLVEWSLVAYAHE